MVSPVQDVSRVPAEGAAAEDEAVCPLPTSTSPRDQQSLGSAVVSREPDVSHVTRVTLVQLHPARPVTSLLWCRGSHSSIKTCVKHCVMIIVFISHVSPAGLSRLPALGTGRGVDPAEELCLEPLLELQQKHVLEQGVLQARVMGLSSFKLFASSSLKSIQRNHSKCGSLIEVNSIFTNEK